MEKRSTFFGNYNSRAIDSNGKKTISGYAAIYNQRSKLINDWEGTYYEIIEPGAFDDVMHQRDLNVIFTRNHDPDKMIARLTRENHIETLKLFVDSRGLHYEAEVDPNISYAIDTWHAIKRGDLYESSFVFSVEVEGQRWGKTTVNGEPVPLRYLTKIARLYDVATVVNGAYSNTNVGARSSNHKGKPLEHFKQRHMILSKPELLLLNEIDQAFEDI
jgi:uncharacterized protein